jgi:hypothetical protein
MRQSLVRAKLGTRARTKPMSGQGSLTCQLSTGARRSGCTPSRPRQWIRVIRLDLEKLIERRAGGQTPCRAASKRVSMAWVSLGFGSINRKRRDSTVVTDSDKWHRSHRDVLGLCVVEGIGPNVASVLIRRVSLGHDPIGFAFFDFDAMVYVDHF